MFPSIVSLQISKLMYATRDNLCKTSRQKESSSYVLHAWKISSEYSALMQFTHTVTYLVTHQGGMRHQSAHSSYGSSDSCRILIAPGAYQPCAEEHHVLLEDMLIIKSVDLEAEKDKVLVRPRGSQLVHSLPYLISSLPDCLPCWL